MNESFASLVDSASSILIILPVKPSFDLVAAGLSLYLSLREKKETVIYSPTPMTVGLNRLVGVNKIATEFGNKNLLITFSNYDPVNIEKVSYDIDSGQFKLTVVPKNGQVAPQREQVQISYAGTSADLIFLIGGVAENDFPSLTQKEFAGLKIAHLGTRVLTSEKEIMSFAEPASCLSELVARIIKENSFSLDSDIATNLVMGIEEGSVNFTSSEAGPETFEIFAYLLRNGGQRQSKVKLSPANFPPGSIPTRPYVQIPQTYTTNFPKPTEPIAEQIEKKEEVVENPPADWLQPKIFTGAKSVQPDTFSENKG